MATRQRRSLWSDIYQSNKVNKLSISAALLYTWAISNFDDYGFQEADPRVIKGVIFPKRDDFTVEKIEELIHEILSIDDSPPLWKLYIVGNETFIQDPVWFDRQSFRGIHKKPSKILKLLTEHQIDTGLAPELVQEGCQNGVLSKDKEKLNINISEEAKALADFLLKEIKSWFPKFKEPPTLMGWGKAIDEMMRLDRRDVGEIKEVITWCQHDLFWRKNILSGTTLRIKFNRLQAEMLSPKPGGPKKQDGIKKGMQKLKEAIHHGQKQIEHKSR